MLPSVVEKKAKNSPKLYTPVGLAFFFKTPSPSAACLRWFRVYFEALEESFPRASNERLMLERAVVDLVACPPHESVERRDAAARWCQRMHGGGFRAWSFNEEVNDGVLQPLPNSNISPTDQLIILTVSKLHT